MYDSLGAGATGLVAGQSLDQTTGYCVDIIPKTSWTNATLLATYDVLWIGADDCMGSSVADFNEAISSRNVWELVIDPAEVMIAGGDYDFHYDNNFGPSARAVTEAMVTEVSDGTSGPGLVLQAGCYAISGAPWFHLLGGSFAGLAHAGTSSGDPTAPSDVYLSHQFNVDHGFVYTDYQFSSSCHGAMTIASGSPVDTTYNLQPLFKVNEQDCFFMSDPNFPPGGGTVHGAKWLDIDRDGVWDDSEPGLAGIKIYIDLTGDGLSDDDLMTFTMEDDPSTPEDETGKFWLDDVPAGTWTIAEVVPDGPYAGYEDGLEQTFPAGDGTHTVFVEGGSHVENILFGNGPVLTPGIGNSPPGSVHGTKWYDANGNGVRDPGEPGIADVVVFADLNGNGKRDPDEPFAETMPDDPSTPEDEAGMYWLEGIPPGDWKIYEILPDGWVQTSPQASSAGGFEWVRIGDADGFGYVDGSGLLNAVADPVNNDGFNALAANDFLPDVDQDGVTGFPSTNDDFDHRTATESAGTAAQASGATIVSSDGSQHTDFGLVTPNSPEFEFDFFIATGDVLPGAPLYLNLLGSELTRLGEVRIQSTLTSADFTVPMDTPVIADIPSNDGIIRASRASVPFYDVLSPVSGGFAGQFTVESAGVSIGDPRGAIDFIELSTAPLLPNQISVGQDVTVLGGQAVEDVDFGNVPACTGHGLKWEDLNGNGVQDPGEVGIPGVTVYWDANNNGMLDIGEATGLTMDDGTFWIKGLPPGTHVIREVLPDGSVSTTGAFTITLEPGCGVLGAPDIDTTAFPGTPTPLPLPTTVSDAFGTPAVFELITAPEHGTITLGQVVTYEAEPGHVGTDTFEYRYFNEDHSSAVGTVTVDVLPNSNAAGDFDNDGDLDCDDINALTTTIATNANDLMYDMDADGLVGQLDLDVWLQTAGNMNLASGAAYLAGDANLDGTVDSLDFIAWNEHKFTANSNWCDGDFNADGIVDDGDLILWNANKFQSAIPDSTPDAIPTFAINVPVLVPAGTPTPATDGKQATRLSAWERREWRRDRHESTERLQQVDAVYALPELANLIPESP